MSPDKGSFVIGGRRPVMEALRSGKTLRVLVARGARETEGFRALIDEAARANTPIEQVDAREIDRLGLTDHQGVAAIVEPPRELDDHGLANMEYPPAAMAVALDGVTDPQNLGACARSAEAAGASVLIVRRRRAAPLTPSAVRASAGALLHLPMARVTNLARTLEQLKDLGFTVVGLDHRAARDIYSEVSPERPLVLVVGSEGAGLSRLVSESCDRLLSIPMPGRTGSLNASAALAVALFGYVLRPNGQD